MANQFLAVDNKVAISMSLERESNNEMPHELIVNGLSESEPRFRSFFENYSDAMLIGKLDGTILAANPAAQRLFGMTEDELIASGRNSLLVKDERMEWALKERSEKGTTTSELTFRRKDGSTFPGEITSTLFKDTDGSIGATIAIRDITERKNADRNLKNAYEETSAILENINLGFLSLDRGWRFIYVNDVAAKNVGFKPSDLVGKRFWEVFPSYANTQAADIYQKVMDDRVPITFNHVGSLTEATYEETVYPTPQGIAVFWKDITGRRKTEEALRRSEESLRSHIENSPLAVVEWDKDFIVTRWAGEAEHLYGYTSEETIGKPIMDMNLVHPEDIPIVERTMAMLTDGISKRVVSSNRNITKHGRILYCTWYNTVLYDANGEMLSVLSFVLDNTARIEAEKALKWRQAKDELLTDIAGKLLATTDAQSVIEDLANRTMRFLDCDVFFNYIADKHQGGITLNAYTGVPIEEMEGMWHLEYGQAVCGRVAQGGKRIVVEDIQTSDDERTPFQRSQGIQAYACNPLMVSDKVIGTLSFGTKSRPKFSDDELAVMQEVAGFISLAMQRMIEQEALKESALSARRQAEEIRAIMDVVPATIWISGNPEGTEMVGNKTTEKLLDVSPGANVSETAPLEERTPHFRAYRNGDVIPPEELPMQKAGMTGQQIIGTEFELRFDDGRSVWLYGNAVPLFDDSGRPRGAVGAFVDMTDHKNAHLQVEDYARRLKKSNDELQEFAYVASHDLQEPLRMITSYLGLLEKRYGNELPIKAKEYVGFAVDGSMRMKELIDDLLQYSRIDSQSIVLEEIDMNEKVKTVVEDLQVAIKETGAEVVVDDLPTIRADRTQIKQLMTNLISNATKFHGDSRPRVEISAKPYGKEYVFSVKDNGIGIEPKFADKLFRMFSRLHTKEEYPGTGIGLAVSKKIVERHGGRIWFESEVGKGTTFYFTLPA